MICIPRRLQFALSTSQFLGPSGFARCASNLSNSTLKSPKEEPYYYRCRDYQGFSEWLVKNPFPVPTTVEAKNVLAMDLDETLLCSDGKDGYDFKAAGFKIHLRPNAIEFLKEVKPYYKEVLIFTAAMEHYAVQIKSELERRLGMEGYFSTILHRKHTERHKDGLCYSEKDLKDTKHPLNQVILVDDSPSNGVQGQRANMLHIPGFYISHKKPEIANCLYASKSLLIHLSQQDDVRVEMERLYKLWMELGLATTDEYDSDLY